jgi:PPP family 3-phenylpropionic acid transporter
LTPGALGAEKDGVPRRTALRVYYFVFFAVIGAYGPYFPAWLRAQGIDGLRMSTITMLVPLFGVASPVVFGVVADAFALRGSLLRICATGALLSWSAIALVGVGAGGASYGTVLVLMACFAFFRGPMVSIADVTALEQPGSYGRTRLFGSAGFLATALVAGAFFDLKNARQLPLAITAFLAATLVVTFRLPARSARPPVGVAKDAVHLLTRIDFLAFLLVGFLWFASHVSYDLCFSMHLADLGASTFTVGACWAVGTTAEVVLMSRAHSLFERYSTKQLLGWGMAATGVRFLLIAYVRSVAVLLLLAPLHALSFGLVWVTSLEFVRRRAPPHVLATAQSLLAAVMAIGSVAGMLAWGPLYASSGGRTVFTAGAAVAGVGALVNLVLVRSDSAVGRDPGRDPPDRSSPPGVLSTRHDGP